MHKIWHKLVARIHDGVIAHRVGFGSVPEKNQAGADQRLRLRKLKFELIPTGAATCGEQQKGSRVRRQVDKRAS